MVRRSELIFHRSIYLTKLKQRNSIFHALFDEHIDKKIYINRTIKTFEMTSYKWNNNYDEKYPKIFKFSNEGKNFDFTSWKLLKALLILFLLIGVFYLVCWCTGPGRVQSNQYIEAYEGTLNVILGAPHGGQLRSHALPKRTAGCWDQHTNHCVYTHTCGEYDTERCKVNTFADLQTKELTLLTRNALFEEMGEYPPTVISNLHRGRMDPNRGKQEGTFGHPVAEEAWEDFHQTIDKLSAEINGPGLYLEIHGQIHANHTMVGYLVTGEDLDSGNFEAGQSSIRSLASQVSIPFEELLRGNYSFGELLQSHGHPAVPSSKNPGPKGGKFFSGAYGIRRHGSITSGQVDAIQLETSVPTRTWGNIQPFSRLLAKSVKTYMETHYRIDKPSNQGSRYYYKVILISLLLSVTIAIKALQST